MAKTFVKSALPKADDGGYPVAFSEKNDYHPNGEVFIADEDVHEVAMTGAVGQALANGQIVLVNESGTELNKMPDLVAATGQPAAGSPAAEGQTGGSQPQSAATVPVKE